MSANESGGLAGRGTEMCFAFVPSPPNIQGIEEAAATDCSDNLPERYITQKKDNGRILSPICPERVGLLLKNLTWKSQVVLASWYIQVEVLVSISQADSQGALRLFVFHSVSLTLLSCVAIVEAVHEVPSNCSISETSHDHEYWG
jgi:hypothetical protein